MHSGSELVPAPRHRPNKDAVVSNQTYFVNCRRGRLGLFPHRPRAPRILLIKEIFPKDISESRKEKSKSTQMNKIEKTKENSRSAEGMLLFGKAPPTRATDSPTSSD